VTFSAAQSLVVIVVFYALLWVWLELQNTKWKADFAYSSFDRFRRDYYAEKYPVTTCSECGSAYTRHD
jgi:hypothetical protein